MFSKKLHAICLGCLAFLCLAATLQASSASNRKSAEEILFNGVKVIEDQAGSSLLLKLASTIKNDEFIPDDLLSHLTLMPPLSIKTTPRPDGFLLSGSFLAGTSYKITLKRGLKSQKGAVLKKDASATVKIPKPTPRISFLLKGRYLSKGGDMKIPVRVRHATETRIHIGYIPDRNLPVWEYADKWGKKNLEETVVKDAHVSLAPMGKEIYMLDLASWLSKGTSGLYRVELSGCTGKKPKQHCSRDTLFLVITNMGLVVKESKNRIYAWAVDLASGNPLPGITIKGYSYKNLDIGRGVTNKEGYCSFPYNPAAKGSALVVTASRGKDYTYLPLEATRVDTSSFRVSGAEGGKLSFLNAFVLERNLYRPGETLHYAVVLRSAETYQGLSLPVVVKIRDPRDRVLLTQRALSDSLGMASFSYTIPGEALTGRYTLELVRGKNTIKWQSFLVKTYVPERIKIRLTPEKTHFTLWQNVRFNLSARYLFGTPVTGGKYRATLNLKKIRRGLYKNYLFGPILLSGEREKNLPSWRIKGKLNTGGKAILGPSKPLNEKQKSPLKLLASVTVEEAGSHRVSRMTAEAPLRTAPLYPGLRLASVTPCQKAVADGVVISPSGKPFKGKTFLRYSIYEIATNYILTYSPQGRRRWERTVTRIPVSVEKKLTVKDGRFSLSLALNKCWMDYLFRVWDPEGGAETELLVPGWRRNRDRPSSPEILKIVLPDKDKAPGETVKATTTLPFPGHLLWTLEQGGVKSFLWQKVAGKTAAFSFTAPQGSSTLYVSAYLYQTRPGSLVTRAFGVARIRVVPHRVKTEISLQMPEKITPGQTMKLKIKGPRGGRALVAVEDEGVLQLTRFTPPDLYALLLAPLRLSVSTSEGLGWILPRFQFLPGGGEARALLKANASPKPRFFQTFSYWKVVTLTPDGTAEVPIKSGNYQGGLRVMVSVLGEEGFASINRYVKVASRVVVQPTLPRLVRQGDTVRFPVSLINTTQDNLKGSLTVKIDKAEEKKEVVLAAGGSRVFFFTLAPTSGWGTQSVMISADFPDSVWRDTYHVHVLPSLPHDSKNYIIKLVKEKPLNLDTYFKDWAKEGLEAHLLLSSSPLFGSLRHVDRLLHYPYGCLEQTSSGLLTLSRLLPFMKYLDPVKGDVASLREKIRSGIVRLIRLQLYYGGFTFWPGNGSPHKWGSIYATFALLESQEAGFHVPQTIIDRALDYLKTLPASPWRDFVLAKAGLLKTQSLKWMKPAKGKKPLGREALLLGAGALQLAGYPEEAKKILSSALKAKAGRNGEQGEVFFSPLRLQALQLYVAQLILPGNPENLNLARGLLVQLNQHPVFYYTTQELAWSLVAMGRFLQAVSLKPLEAVLEGNGIKLPLAKATHTLFSWSLKSPFRHPLVLKQTKPEKAWLSLTVSGYRTRGYKPVKNKGLQISRHLYTRAGKAISTVTPGNLLFMEVKIINLTPGTLRHCAIRLPMVAGLEVVNPRFFSRQPAAWKGKKKHLFKPSYIDVRDHETTLFGSLLPGKNIYYLLLRATFSYKGVIPPPEVEPMYMPWIRSTGEMRSFEVQ
jgi:uncharacterized protein YfaS (alpha-2-macroglobulin family)